MIWLMVLALAISIGRTLLDWGFVYPEMGFTDPVGVLVAIVVYAAIFGAWVYGVVSAAQGRRAGLWIALAFTLLLNVGLGLGTTFAFCPTPCQTVWPVGELWNWATTISGLLAVAAIWRAMRVRPA